MISIEIALSILSIVIGASLGVIIAKKVIKIPGEAETVRWVKITLFMLAAIIGITGSYQLMELLWVMLPDISHQAFEFDIWWGQIVLSFLMMGVLLSVAAIMNWLLSPKSRIGRAFLLCVVLMFAAGLIVKLFVAAAQIQHFALAIGITLVVYALLAIRYYWYEGLQDNFSVTIGAITCLGLTYALLRLDGVSSLTSHFISTEHAYLAPILLVAGLYLLAIVFGKKVKDQDRISFVVCKYYLACIVFLFAVFTGLNAMDSSLQYKAKVRSLSNSITSYLDELENRKVLSTAVGGHNINTIGPKFRELKESCETGGYCDEAELQRLSGILVEYKEDLDKIKPRKTEEGELSKQIKRFFEFVSESTPDSLKEFFTQTPKKKTGNLGGTGQVFSQLGGGSTYNTGPYKRVQFGRTPENIERVYSGDKIVFSSSAPFYVQYSDNPKDDFVHNPRKKKGWFEFNVFGVHKDGAMMTVSCKEANCIVEYAIHRS